MSEVIIGTVRSRTRITDDGGFQEYYEVPFTVDGARHKLEMPIDGFTVAKAEELVRARADELVKAQGRKVNLGGKG